MKAKHFCEAGAIRAATNTTCGVKKKLRDPYQPLHWWVNKITGEVSVSFPMPSKKAFYNDD